MLRRFRIPETRLLILVTTLVLGLVFWWQLKPLFWWSVIFGQVKQSQGLTNVLLLGVPGGNHAGSDLTDTMIFFSFNQRKNHLVLVSLPRDIWSPALQAKINNAYLFGEEKKPGGGFLMAKAITEEVTGLPVHYAVKIDLAGLKKLIDLVGGVQVNVENSFDDDKFPIEGKENDACGGDPEFKCRYLHLHFDKGWQLLRGEEALQYIRSRQAQGDEGTDFARNKRQQKLILALKEKIFSLKILLNPVKWLSLFKALDEAIDVDIPQEQLPLLTKLIIFSDLAKVKSLSLEEFLVNPPVWQYQGQWILIPVSGDFNQIQDFLKKQLLD